LRCSFISFGGKKYTGQTKLATLALTASFSTTLAFDYTPGSLADTNIAFNGSDILDSVGTAEIKVTNLFI
jgi:hypothetical protein